MNFLFAGLAATYAFNFVRPLFKCFSVALGLLSLAFTPLLMNGYLFGFGGVQRLVVYVQAIWSTGLGASLMQKSSS